MRKLFSHGLFVFAGVVAVPAAVTHADTRDWDMRKHQATDPRLHLLRQFFKNRFCPAAELAQEFLDEADTFKLDWRLLPSLSVVESGGGKSCKRHNMFGWQNGLASFPSFRAGLHHVAFTLANAKYYRNKPLEKLLATYNPNASYGQSVKAVMRSIYPSANVPLSLHPA
jgi:hypothetical protein